MTLKPPDELLQSLNSAMETIRGSSDLSPAVRRKIYEDLVEIYNYVSASSRKPSLINTVYSQSAHVAKIDAQIQRVSQDLDKHKDFVEKTFEKSEQYFRTFQLGGYAAFFAVWTLVRDWISPLLGTLAATCMLLSVVIFSIWELGKVWALSQSLKWHASVTKSNDEAFLERQFERLWKEKPSIEYLAIARPRFLRYSIGFGGAALVLLLMSLLGFLATTLFQ